LVSKVVAFEPNPIVVERLKENVKLNCKPNVEVFNVAVSNSKGKTKFVLSRFYQSSHLLTEDDKLSNNIIEVETTTIDALVKEGLPIPNVVKMDVEGAEHLAVKGMRNALADDCRILYCEVHPYLIKKYGSSPEKLEKALRSMKFNIEKIELKRGLPGFYWLKACKS
jgi:FkbM family methyltransferase